MKLGDHSNVNQHSQKLPQQNLMENNTGKKSLPQKQQPVGLNLKQGNPKVALKTKFNSPMDANVAEQRQVQQQAMPQVKPEFAVVKNGQDANGVKLDQGEQGRYMAAHMDKQILAEPKISETVENESARQKKDLSKTVERFNVAPDLSLPKMLR